MAAPNNHSNPSTLASNELRSPMLTSQPRGPVIAERDILPTTPARVRGSTQDVKTKLELDFELKTHASIRDLYIAQSPQSRQHSGPESVRLSPVRACPKVTMLSMLTTMLRIFHLERMSGCV